MTTSIPYSSADNSYDLLDDVKLAILGEPECIKMDIVLLRGEGIEKFDQYHFGLSPLKKPSCGAVGCVAGLSLTMKGLSREDEYSIGSSVLTRDAAELLGLSLSQKAELFFPRELLLEASSFSGTGSSNLKVVGEQ